VSPGCLQPIQQQYKGKPHKPKLYKLVLTDDGQHKKQPGETARLLPVSVPRMQATGVRLLFQPGAIEG